MINYQKSKECIYLITIILFSFTLLLTIFDESHFIGIKDKNFKDKVFNRLYFVITTLSSANYGDVMPKSRIVKIISMILQLIIIFGVFAIFIKF